MLKITGIPNIFSLRNAWHDKLCNDLKIKNIPYSFMVIEKIETEKGIYIAVDVEKKKTKIAISETALKYLSGIEVPDCNIGMYFNDYLPTENNYLILNNKGIITPVKFELKISNYQDLPFIDLILKNLILDEAYTVLSKIKESWKFIIYGSDIEKAVNHTLDLSQGNLDERAKKVAIYMTDTEQMYQDTFIHKTIVEMVCNKFANYLEKEGLVEDAKEIRSKGKVHDNSKILNKTEFNALTGIIEDKSCLRDANQSLSSYKQDAIELHWKNNSHHPEHFENISDMKRIDRLEFVCDCCARSIQYGTDLIEFMKTRQENRFHFPEIMFDEIIHTCKIVSKL